MRNISLVIIILPVLFSTLLACMSGSGNLPDIDDCDCPGNGADDDSANGIEMTSADRPIDEKRALLIRILEDTGSFVSPDNGITYDLKKNEVIAFPYNVANILVDAKKAEPIE